MKTINLKDAAYEITLLTAKEYDKYKEIIPPVKNWWWLRSPGKAQDDVANVLVAGFLNYDFIDYDDGAARPALKSEIFNLPIGEKFIALGNRWIMIDDGIAISEGVVTHRRYDANSNVWETSELKAWLEEWAKEGDVDVVDRDEGIRIGAELAAMHGSDATTRQLEESFWKGVELGYQRAQEERKTGKWIDSGLDGIGAMGIEYRFQKCSECGNSFSKAPGTPYPKYCSWCGAMMIGGDNNV